MHVSHNADHEQITYNLKYIKLTKKKFSYTLAHIVFDTGQKR